MKRILLMCFLLTATCSVISVQHASAQAVTQTSFLTKVNAMDVYTGAGDNTNADATWTSIHTDMLAVLAKTKASIANATTPADVTYYKGIMTNQVNIYHSVWDLHTDLVANRATIKTNLTSFDGTIY